MKTGIVIQARMASSRLPGKILKPLAGEMMLVRIVRLLSQCQLGRVVIVATTDTCVDDPVTQIMKDRGIPVFRGSEADVLGRYVECMRHFDLDTVVRATADNPFVDPEECDRLIEYHHDHGLDYTAAFPSLGGGLPVGIGVEAFSSRALEQSNEMGRADHHREHVNEYVQENLTLFRCGIPPTPQEKVAPNLSFTVDTPEDFCRAERLVNNHLQELGNPDPSTSWLIRRCNF